MRLRYGLPYWLERARDFAVPAFSRQRGNLNSDVVIVGGGFTGCAAAHTFASAGLNVIVLERARLGRGSASASTALLMQETDCSFVDLHRRYGSARARTLARLSARAVADLVGIARTLDCDLHLPHSFRLATSPSGARLLRRDYDARARAGFAVRWLDEPAIERLSGIQRAVGFSSTGNAVVDPYRLTLALAQAACERGAAFFERSPALHIASTRDGVTVTTPAGMVTAAYAVIATGFATPEFKPLMARFKMKTTYVIATERISPRARRAIGNAQTMFWDTEQPYHYFRWTPDARVLLGGMDRKVPTSKTARRNALIQAAGALKETLGALFPAGGPFRVSHAWDGLFATTPDGLPYIGPHRRYRRQLFALGYGGNGMTLGFLAGQVLLRYVLNRPLPSDRLFGFNRFRASHP
jgi:glycine/D-amino acid oxidase-like deaminating enzyme